MTVHDEVLKRLTAGLDRPVIQNAVRSMYVEYQVAVLLEPEWELVGTNWGGWDFQAPSGHRLELKQAAAKQSWPQARPSAGVFDIAPRTGYYDGARWIEQPGRLAHLYVFAWHGRWDDSADQRDESQWEYFVVPTHRLPAQKTIGLGRRRPQHPGSDRLGVAIALAAAGFAVWAADAAPNQPAAPLNIDARRADHPGVTGGRRSSVGGGGVSG